MPQGWDSYTETKFMGFGKDGKGVIFRQSLSQALGTLDNAAGILIGTKPAILERFRIIKSEAWSTINALTSGEGVGIILGLADGDFSISEIEQAIETNGPLGPNDLPNAAQAERFIMFVGMTDGEVGTTQVFENEKGGHSMENTVRWTFARTKSWNWFAYNLGDQLTTGSTLVLRAKSFGVWVI